MTARKVWEASNREYLTESTDRLRALFPKGSTVTTTVKHVSQSGMARVIAVFGVTADGTITNASSDVARVLGWKLDDRQGVYVQGCGMDMAFHLTYTLARKLYADDTNYADAGYLLNNRNI